MSAVRNLSKGGSNSLGSVHLKKNNVKQPNISCLHNASVIHLFFASMISSLLGGGTILENTCPLNYGLEVFGDRWSLLVIRDIAFWGKRTFGEFLRSSEKPATNILAGRLLRLEKSGLIVKRTDEKDKRKEIYSLTEKGLDLIPMLMEIGAWAAKYDPRQPEEFKQFVTMVRADQQRLTAHFIDKVRNGGAIFSDAVGRQSEDN